MNMRTDNDLDSLFKEKFSEFDSEIPTESFLEDLDQRLMSKNSKKRLGYWKWYLSSLLLFFSLVGWATWYYYSLGQVKTEPNYQQLQHTNEKLQSLDIKTDNPSSRKIKCSNNSLLKHVAESVTNTKNRISGVEASLIFEKSSLIVNANFSATNNEQIISEIPIGSETKVDTLTLVSAKELVDSTAREEKKTTTESSKNDIQQKKKWNFSAAVLNGVSQIYSSKGTPSLSSAQQEVFTSNYTEDDLKNVIRNRRAIESSLTSWDLSIRLEANRANMVFSSGLDFIRLGERITFNDTAGLQQLNSFSYVNLPLNLGWKKAFNKFSIQPFVGAALGFSVGTSIGNYVVTNNLSSNYMVSNNRSESFVAMGQLGCMLEYVSISGFKVMVSPMLRTSLSNVVNDGLITTRYTSIGLQMGVGYQW